MAEGLFPNVFCGGLVRGVVHNSIIVCNCDDWTEGRSDDNGARRWGSAEAGDDGAVFNRYVTTLMVDCQYRTIKDGRRVDSTTDSRYDDGYATTKKGHTVDGTCQNW